MPVFSAMPAERKGKLNVMIYGPSQTKKTLWAARAAEAGYDVIFLMGEQNYGILRLLSPEAQKRVTIIRCWDTAESSVFGGVVGTLTKQLHGVWDDDANRFAHIPPDSAHNHIILRLKQLTTNTVLVLDSLSALAESIIRNVAKKLNVDLTEGERAGDVRGFYSGPGIIMQNVFNIFPNLPCHFICIAHSVLIEQKRKDLADPKKEIITGYRVQPISVSMPNAAKIAKVFQEVYYFNMLGTSYKIDTTTTSERDGGSRIVPGKQYNWDDLQFIDVVKASADIALPNPEIEDHGIKHVVAGGDMTGAFVDTTPTSAKTTPNFTQTTIDASSTKPAMGGLAALFKKKDA